MSIIIKGLHKPHTCGDCWFGHCDLWRKRNWGASPPDDCPIEAAPATDRNAGEWIPVAERLPDERHAVIVWEPKYLNPYICVLSEGEWYVFGGYGVKVFGVTHWMPLPKPPKEDE